jgi:hypothetical protein
MPMDPVFLPVAVIHLGVFDTVLGWLVTSLHHSGLEGSENDSPY